MCQVVVSSCCVKLSRQVVVSSCRVKLSCQVVVSSCRVKLSRQVVASSCRVKLSRQVVASSCCVKLSCQVVVSCCSLDWQRPLREDVDPPDEIVRLQREVANLTLGVTRLHARPVLARDRFWGVDVTRMEGELDNSLQLLRLEEDDRRQGTGHSSRVRLQQLLHQMEALAQNRRN